MEDKKQLAARTPVAATEGHRHELLNRLGAGSARFARTLTMEENAKETFAEIQRDAALGEWVKRGREGLKMYDLKEIKSIGPVKAGNLKDVLHLDVRDPLDVAADMYGTEMNGAGACQTCILLPIDPHQPGGRALDLGMCSQEADVGRRTTWLPEVEASLASRYPLSHRCAVMVPSIVVFRSAKLDILPWADCFPVGVVGVPTSSLWPPRRHPVIERAPVSGRSRATVASKQQTSPVWQTLVTIRSVTAFRSLIIGLDLRDEHDIKVEAERWAEAYRPALIAHGTHFDRIVFCVAPGLASYGQLFLNLILQSPSPPRTILKPPPRLLAVAAHGDLLAAEEPGDGNLAVESVRECRAGCSVPAKTGDSKNPGAMKDNEAGTATTSSTGTTGTTSAVRTIEDSKECQLPKYQGEQKQLSVAPVGPGLPLVSSSLVSQDTSTNLLLPHVFVAVRVVTDGPDLTKHNLLSVDACALSREGRQVGCFTRHLHILPERGRRTREESGWGVLHPEVWDACHNDRIPVSRFAEEFGAFLVMLLTKYRVCWVSHQASSEWPWLTTYYTPYKPQRDAPPLGDRVNCLTTLFGSHVIRKGLTNASQTVAEECRLVGRAPPSEGGFGAEAKWDADLFLALLNESGG